ncbi:hypothetical protein [Leptolyngbya sp. 7M]|uniref:hypothetical protein n=1 Tax=Leptolyngbya sp. 7M TaxID=2812896 RepID=UPI001B8BAC22|nr:hypothetical protein [Leptolyngbya sp. 7M]QYO67496.1 hypothetical protein JVX88_12295 [Leptolyngbya sp. 7M]
MTVAALEAKIVDQFFQRHSIDSLAQQTHALQKRLATAHQEAWSAATNMDYRYHSVPNKPTDTVTRFANWYWDQLLELVVDRAGVHHTFLEVLHLLKPSIALFHPAILAQVLWHDFRKRWQRSVPQQESTISTL